MPVRTENRQVHITDDDQEFTDKKDAEVHQALLENKEGINAFIEQMSVTEIGQKKAKNLLMKFIQFDAARKFKESK